MAVRVTKSVAKTRALKVLDTNSERVLRYVVERAAGLNATQAAIRAGYANPSVAGHRLERQDRVQAALRMAEARRRDELRYSRDDLFQELREALVIAKMSGDASAIVRAVAEINKMCGYYAPEQRELTLKADTPAHRRREALESASEEDLLAMIGGPAGMQEDVLDGEFEEIEETE